MTDIDRANQVVYDTLSGKYGDFGHHEEVGQALADAGLLAPGPQIIHTREDLEALDQDTLLFSYDWELYEDAEYWIDNIDDDVFQLAVIATGGQVRAARRALGERRCR